MAIFDHIHPKFFQFDWLTAFFLSMSQEQNFSMGFGIWDLCSNTENQMNFHYRTNSVKIYDQIFL